MRVWDIVGEENILKLETKAFANVWRSRDGLSAYSRALLAMAAEESGDHDSALILVRNLENGVKVDRAPDHRRRCI